MLTDMNKLDQFIERGNIQSAPILDDIITYQGNDYACTVSDLQKDVFFETEAIGKRLNAERMLEIVKSVFGATPLPKIDDRVTYLGSIYRIVEVMSDDTTNIMYRIRKEAGQ